jgi:hypothetical protein
MERGGRMNVYVITSGEYSDYGICAVTLDKEQAELLKAKYSDKWDEACIEEYDTDNYKIEVDEDYKLMWVVEFYSNEIRRCYTIARKNFKHGAVRKHSFDNGITVFVEAKDEDHAKKIAKDIYMKWLAEQNNL